MTITTYKDQLFSKVNELGIAQQEVDNLRSAIHGIIATLPSETKTEGADAPPTPPTGQAIIIQCRRDGCNKEPALRFSCENHTKERRDHNPEDRPFVIKPPQLEIPETKLPLELPPSEAVIEEKPKKTRAKRTSETDIRKAVKLVYDENLTQKEAEIVCNLPPGTLSRRKGKQIMDGYRKEWGRPNRVEGERGVQRKDVEDGNRYEKR